MTTWFWGWTALLAGAAAMLMILFARREARRAGGEDPELAVHRRHLADLDELEARGLLNPEDRAAARAEAGRRLLKTAARASPKEVPGGIGSGRVVAVAAVSAGALALVLYLAIGAPGAADEPFRSRLLAWRAEDPGALNPLELAAVLKDLSLEHPNDPRLFAYLGRAESGAGDPYGAARAFRRACALDPKNAEDHILLGESLLDATQGKPTPEASREFERALELDPNNLIAGFSLGRLDILDGRRDEGLKLWRAVLANLSPQDPRRPPFTAALARVAAGGSPDPPLAEGPGGVAGQAAPAFIRGMVQGLEARLQKAPDDPEGWARLVRSYGVLHDKEGQSRALAGAKRAARGDPQKLEPALQEARLHPA
jgi:cytochrome c-type biogenesis protein CcmH